MIPDLISVLLVSSRTPPAQLADLLRQSASVLRASGRREALEILAQDTPVQAVVTAETLADGDWRGVLNDSLQANSQMQVVVYTGPLPEMEMFREARALGARSLLVEPYDRYQIECFLRGVQPAARHRASPTKKPPRASPALSTPGTSVLLVSAGSEYKGLMQCFQSYGLAVHHASNRSQARELLATGDPFEFVVTTELLPDGTWRGVAEDVRQECPGAQVFVASDSRDAPGLVLETISQGVALLRLRDRRQMQWMIELAVARFRWKAHQAAPRRAVG